MNIETLDTAAMTSSNITYGGSAVMTGSGAFVFMGHSVTQIEIAMASMLIGALIGLAGLLANIIFKWLAHVEQCRVNRVTETAKAFQRANE